MKEEIRRTVEVVAALIMDDAGRVLAAQCAPHKHGGGWEFPGGKLESGEDAAMAVEREIAEELGLQVEAGKLVGTVEWDYPDFHLRMHCLRCQVRSGCIRLHEHTAVRWLGAGELRSVDWLPADVAVLDAVERELRAEG